MGFQSLIITNKQVMENISLERAISCVEDTWRWHGEGKVVMPPKITTDMTVLGVEGWFNSMPSYLQPMNMAGIKVVGGYMNNPKNGLPFIKSNLLLTDPNHGTLRALVCGDWISDARTGAQPAIAMKYLAASTDIVTIIGAGSQAYYCLACIMKRHKLKELRVCDIRKEAREGFAARFPELDFKVIPYASNKDACKDADVIITITTANEALVDESWCKEGCLVITMGSFTETAENVPQKFDKLFVDSISQGLHRGNFKSMAEKGIVNEHSFAAELTEVAAGKKLGRTNPRDRILCELVGMGSLDLCIASVVYYAIIDRNVEVLSVDMLGE